MHRITLFALSALLAGSPALASEPVAIGSRRELFVDRLLIDHMKGASLALQRPVPAGVALKFDQPWEGRFSAYITVLHYDDANKYQLYYRGNAGFKDGTSGEVTCYAESADGAKWTKPKLGLHEIEGSKDNNVMLANMPPFTHNFAPFIDERPGVAKEQRYKALAGLGGKNGGLCAFASADGLHWKKLQDAPVITKGAFDSQNVSFWSASEQCYVAYFRIFTAGVIDEKTWKPKGVRWVSRATSKDFVSWTDATPMTCDQPLVDHIYISQTHPYFRAPHLYVSTAARFMPGTPALTAEQKPLVAEDKKAYATLDQDCSEAVLMTTRAGTTQYNRTFMEGFVRPGLDFRNWTSRSNYPACGVVQTGRSEMSMFVERHYGQGTAQLERFTLRLDGFSSLHAGYEGGEMTTKPISFTGKALHTNFATGASGHLAVEIQDAGGNPIPGFTASDCTATPGDDIDRVITWKSGSDVSSLTGKPVRLHWVMKDTDVFSFWFE